MRSNIRHESLPILRKNHKISSNPEKTTKIEQKLWSFRDKNIIFVAKMRAERDLSGENRDNQGIMWEPNRSQFRVCKRQMSKNKKPQIPRDLRSFLRDFIGIEEFFLSLGGKCVSGRKCLCANLQLISALSLGIAIYTLSPRV